MIGVVTRCGLPRQPGVPPPHFHVNRPLKLTFSVFLKIKELSRPFANLPFFSLFAHLGAKKKALNSALEA